MRITKTPVVRCRLAEVPEKSRQPHTSFDWRWRPADLSHAPKRGLLAPPASAMISKTSPTASVRFDACPAIARSCPRPVSAFPSVAAGAHSTLTRASMASMVSKVCGCPRPVPACFALGCRSVTVKAWPLVPARRGVFHGEGEMGAGGQTGRQLIADQARLVRESTAARVAVRK